MKNLSSLVQHPVRSLLWPLQVMQELGYGRQACLKGTGILLSEIEHPEIKMTLQQQLTFYRNTLDLTGDCTIGLKLGEPFIPQKYGLFGYAFLSAATFRHALRITKHFGALTFSFFSFEYGEDGDSAWFAMTDPPPIKQQLLDLYIDRDMSAAVVAFDQVLGEALSCQQVHLTHDGHGCRDRYRAHFGTQVVFSSYPSRLVFPAEILDRPLPEADPESSRQLQLQCQVLIAKLSTQSSTVDDVRMLILEQPGRFPCIRETASKLNVSTRTLRRRLKEQHSSYRSLLDEIRFGLAREYLAETGLPISEVSNLLGYSETGNFAHAFRRWSGQAPSKWRQLQAST